MRTANKFKVSVTNDVVSVQKPLPDLRPTDTVKRATSLLEIDLEALRVAKRERDAAELHIAHLTARIKHFLGDATALLDTTGTELLATYRQDAAVERFDAAAFQAAHPKLWHKFVRTVPGNRPLKTKN